MKSLDVKTISITQHSQNIDRYFSEISKYDLLTQNEEIELFKKSDNKSLDIIVKSNLRFVVSCAKKYQNYSNVNFLDLINAGNIGLIIASKRFDYTKGFKFISYAVWWIRANILLYIRANDMIRIPQYIINNEIKQYNLYLKEYKDGIPKHLDNNVFINILSLDNSISNDESGLTFGDVVVDETADNFPIFNEPSEKIKLALSKLNPREKDFLIKYYGLYDSKTYTTQDIAEETHLTCDRIRQIRLKAEHKLKIYLKQSNSITI